MLPANEFQSNIVASHTSTAKVDCTFLKRLPTDRPASSVSMHKEENVHLFTTLNQKPMQFGNWTVTNDSIKWSGNSFQRFVIPVAKLEETRTEGDEEYYEWIMLATNEDWLTQNDLYDLNYAFVYAIAKAGLSFNYDIFDATLEKQFDQFDREDEEDFEL